MKSYKLPEDLAVDLSLDEVQRAAREAHVEVEEVLKRMVLAVKNQDAVPSVPDDDWLLRTCPHLWALLNFRRVGGKVSKDPTKVSFHIDGSLFYWTVSDASLNASGSLTSVSLLDGLQLLDRAITGKDDFWRPWKRRKGKLVVVEDEKGKKPLTFDENNGAIKLP